ncbi:MAG: restriction endonuclease [Chitinispirillia bacterium]|nr:restriction endonuclease [Chitinispirillia bacterium]
MKTFAWTVLWLGGIALLIFIWAANDGGWVIVGATVTFILMSGVVWPVSSAKNRAAAQIANAEKSVLDMQQLAKAAREKLKKEKEDWISEHEAIRDKLFKTLDSKLGDKEATYKWIAPIIADIRLYHRDLLRPDDELVSRARSWDACAKLDILRKEKRALETANRELLYEIEYIKTLMDDDIEDDYDYSDEVEDADSPDWFLTQEEYQILSDRKKNERALEYYRKRDKKKWEIGRDFERYIGYMYEEDGYTVEYFGIEKRLQDMGRDIIAKRRGRTDIVQCKYWSRNKTVHEKHIAQLYGTTAMYKITEGRGGDVRAVFVTSASLSDTARLFADRLGIKIREGVEIGEYPLIKCNIGRNEYGEAKRIYHLPMDQQYDTVKIERDKGERYAFTVAEAEDAGFRRAYRWHGVGDG